MEQWKLYIHTFIVIVLVALAASMLWLLWPVIAALLVGIGVYLVVKFILFVFNFTVSLASLREKKTDKTK
jgi:hypothetical protein